MKLSNVWKRLVKNSEKDVERRYEESFRNLAAIIPQSDLVALYDNTSKFRRFAIIKQGSVVFICRGDYQLKADTQICS